MIKKHVLAIATIMGMMMSACGGNSNEGGTAGTAAKPAAADGANIYKRTCISCHQAGGEGIANTYPPLAKSDFLADREKVIKQVIKGFMGEMTVNGVKYNSVMPAQQLDDAEVAAVLTYVYSNFGNTGAAVTAAEVKDVRAKL
jgi:nitrite reductase (NO-forming)